MSIKTDNFVQAIFLSVVVACWQMFFKLEENADIYFVMNIGRHILESGFPQVDPFTIHENLKLVPQQWLSGIFFWEAYKLFGVNGLQFLDCIIGAIAIVIYWRLCIFISGGNKFLAFLLSFVVGIIAATMILPRPQIFSTLLLLIEVFLLEKFTRTKDFKFLLPLPLLSILLINFHAAVWLMSLVVCLPFLFVKDTRHAKFLLAAMAAIFLCGLINPYGLDAMTYVLRSYGVDLISQGVKEMATPTAHDLRGKIFYLSAALIIFALSKFKVAWRYIFLSGGITFMAVMHGRNLILFYFLATLPLAYAWKSFGAEKSLVKGGELLRRNLLLFAVTLIIGGIFFTTLDGNKREPDGTFAAAMKFLIKRERPENISLYVNQGYGGLAGMFGIKYYIDSRSEVFIAANNKRKNILAEYVNFRSGKIYYKDFFARYKFTHIIVASDDYFLYRELTDDKNFRVIYEGERVEGYKVIRCKIFIPKNEA